MVFTKPKLKLKISFFMSSFEAIFCLVLRLGVAPENPYQGLKC